MHKFRKFFIRIIIVVLGIFGYGLCVSNINDTNVNQANILGLVDVYADVVYTNEDNGYEVIIEDDADLLSESEKMDLQEEMEKITKWGNVAFKTIDYNPDSSTKIYIKDYYYRIFGNNSGTVFLIDMDERNIWIYSDGKIYDTITSSYADTITDNVYKYASDGKYYKCSSVAFKQIYTLLSGHRIAQPMKYISNAFLAIILALIINYFIVRRVSASQKASKKELLQGMVYHCAVNEPKVTFRYQTKKYDPPSSSSSSGGGHSGGGGGHSGGGGGHSF